MCVEGEGGGGRDREALVAKNTWSATFSNLHG